MATPPVPYQTPMTNERGLPTQIWAAFFRTLASASGGGGGTGTVTSVALSAPAIFTVSGSPVTSSGTLSFTLASQSANTVFAGPTSGAAGAPTFRALVAGDIPTLNQNTTGSAGSFTGSLSGDVTGTQSSTVVGRLNGVSLAGLSTGILKNTTTTGAPSIAVAADFPTLNQSTTGNAATATAPQTGSAHGAVTLDTSGHFQSVAPGAAGHYLRSNGTDYVDSAIQAADVPTLNQNTTGSAASFTGNLAGDVTGTQGATTVGKINGTSLAGLATGILKNTTTTGVPSIAVAADFPTLNQNTTGTAANVTGTVALGNGGTGQTTAAAAYNALSPMTTLGDIEYESAANTASRLAGNTTTTKKFLTQTGTGTVSAAPGWNTIAGSDLPSPSATTLGGIQSLASATSKWVNAISTSGVPSATQPAFSDLSGNIATSQMNSGTSASSTTFWRGDGTWATPGGGGTVTSVQVAGAKGLSFSGGPITSSGTITAALTAPTIQKFTSGSGTYTTPTSPAPLFIRVRMAGGGGGGGGSGDTVATTGGAGGNTTFGTTLLVANGGGSGTVGGTASLGTGPIGIALTGGTGTNTTSYGSSIGHATGSPGAASPFGGAGGGGSAGNAGSAAVSNSGSGGGGGGANSSGSNGVGGAGGGAGGFVEAIITSPSATYSYAVGSGGSAGSAGTNGFAGGAGGSGIIVVEEYYS